jgi:hypothetical protein
MILPPLQFSSSSSSKSGDIGLTQANDHSGMIVNYGAGSSLGAASLSPWLIAAALVGYLVWKKKS